MAEYENHSNTYGLGVAGTTLWSIGTALGLANGGLGNLLGGFGGNTNQYVTKEAFELGQTISAKDSEIALLKSDANTENKITEVYKLLKADINNLERTQNAWNASQSVANAQMSSAIAVNTNSISALQTLCNNLTKVVIPITNVCPQPAVATTQPTNTQ